MNIPQKKLKSAITLDMICQQKSEKQAEIQATKKQIKKKTLEIFYPSETTSGSTTLINKVYSGIAIFNGVMTGFKIIKQIRNIFHKQ